jgi:uncharacterized membrane protein
MRKTLVLSLLLLSACQKEPDAPAPATPAGPTRSDFSGAIDARGTEPFWAMKIRGTQLTFSRPDMPDLVAQAPGAVIQPGSAAWTAKTPDGASLKVSLYVSPCSDGMSDTSYPMSAEVTLDRNTYSGCAAKTAQMPRPAR